MGLSGVNGGGGSGGGDEDVSAVEIGIMVVGVVVAAALVGFAVSQGLAGDGAAAPTVTVTDQRSLDDGRTAVAVRLENDMDVGLVSATVAVECTDPPAEVTFENVPADGVRTATVVCPSGTADPGASVSGWTAA